MPLSSVYATILETRINSQEPEGAVV